MPERRDEHVLPLIDLIYDASTNPDGWVPFLSQLAVRLGGVRPTLFVQNRAGGTRDGARLLASVGIEAGMARRYEEYYASRNVWLESRLSRAMPGRVRTSEMYCSDAALLRSEYYNDFLRALDIRHAIAGTIGAVRDHGCHLSVFRSQEQGPFGEGDVRFLEALMPHLARAIHLAGRLQTLEQQVHWHEESLDKLATAVLFIDPIGRVVFANRSARGLLEQRDGLSLEPAGLRAATPAATRSLYALAFEANDAGRVAAAAGGVISLPRRSGRRPLEVAVAPFSVVAATGFAPRASAALFVTDPESAIGTPPTTLARLFNLTPAEAHVAERLANGADIHAISDETGTSVQTIRTHVKRILAKTGTRRQAELVAVLLRVPGVTDPNAG